MTMKHDHTYHNGHTICHIMETRITLSYNYINKLTNIITTFKVARFRIVNLRDFLIKTLILPWCLLYHNPGKETDSLFTILC